MPLAGQPVLSHIVRRARSSKLVSEVWVATSDDPSDDQIKDWCDSNSVNCFRGSLTDVLDRFAALALDIGSPWVLRITGDCPVVDPKILDEVIAEVQRGKFDAYGLHGEFPNGLDCTAFSLESLKIARDIATLPSEREHVGPFILNRPTQFNIGQFEKFTGLGHHRWTLDEPEDYDLLTLIFDHLFEKNPIFGTEEILELSESRPWLSRLNADVERGEGLKKSLEEDMKHILTTGD
jgi:spore coat polysaccharide biosynthesis protein SpsF